MHHRLEQNKNNSYNLKVFDEKNKIVYKEKFEKEPFIEIIDKHIIRVTISVGSPLNYTYFYDISSKKESPVYENALLAENNKIVIGVFHDLNLVNLFGEKVILLDQGQVISKGKPKEVFLEHNLKKVYNLDIRNFMLNALKKWQ